MPGDHEFHRDTWFQQLGGVGFAIGACEPLPARPPSGAADVVAGAAMETGGCASRGTLTIRTPEREAIEIDPCAFAGKGGALIDATADGLRLAPARRQENRMWTQPLYAPVPKAASGSKEDPPASQAAPSVKLRVPPPPPASQSREDAAPSKAEAAQ